MLISFVHRGKFLIAQMFLKLKEKEVLEIINNKDSLYQWQIALAYDISQTQVSRIINKKRWNHI